METRPNLFSFATKELSQDAFFSWLLTWADPKYKSVDSELNSTANSLVKLLLNETNDFEISSIKIEQQSFKIDISAIVNDKYYIIIEDKTTSREHDNQLDNYKKKVSEYYADKNYQIEGIYLKSGNEYINSLKGIIKNGYRILGRNEILSILKPYEGKNHIFNDFRKYIRDIDEQTNSFKEYDKLTRNFRSAEGLYLFLENEITFKENDNWGWHYVPNQTGGFHGFWFNFVNKGIYTMYIQIENRFENGFKVAVKIQNGSGIKLDLYSIYEKLKSLSEMNDCELDKPNILKAGNTSTVAFIKNPLQIIDNQINTDDLIRNLNNLVKIVDEFNP